MDAAGPLIVSGYIRDDDDGEEEGEEAPLLGFGVRFYIVGGRDRHLSTFFLGLPLPLLCTVSKGFFIGNFASFGSYSSPGSGLRCALILHSLLLKIFGMEVT